jgi:hypothetical protein
MMTDNWIKVEDGLPEMYSDWLKKESNVVLVYTNYNSIRTAIVQQYDFEDGEECQIEWISACSEVWNMTGVVTHWMPLPTPPIDK